MVIYDNTVFQRESHQLVKIFEGSAANIEHSIQQWLKVNSNDISVISWDISGSGMCVVALCYYTRYGKI